MQLGRAELEKALELDETAIRVVEEKVRLTKARVEAKKKAIAEAKMKAIDEFWALLDFEAEVTEESMVAYWYGFQACKAQVTHYFPEVDVIHDGAHLEGLVGFNLIMRKLEEDLYVAEAQKKATEEAKEKAEEDATWARVVEEKVRLTKARVEAKKKAIAEAKMKAIDEFWALLDFEAEVTEESMVAYWYGFQACKAQVTHYFPEVDVSRLDLDVIGDEAEDED
ncbi:hypothetical protein COCNU_03G009590 [Cocos nucifera]|uniref:Uncharacterized protein n=1 Tax=Cocos nucifera TaxID=13894 RepID=A0A8K0MYU4_COCNU|nr:hypothetical protein COCNU_03G009590 [Cocos nucifera]